MLNFPSGSLKKLSSVSERFFPFRNRFFPFQDCPPVLQDCDIFCQGNGTFQRKKAPNHYSTGPDSGNSERDFVPVSAVGNSDELWLPLQKKQFTYSSNR